MFDLEEGWLTVLLLLVMVMLAAWGISVAGWAQGLWAGWFTGVLGVLAGLALAKSRFSGGQAALFATVYGIFVVGFFISAILTGDWHERSVELVTRLATFVYKAIFGGTSRDFLPFPVLAAGIFWTAGVTGAWGIFRRRSVWPAVIPGGTILLINAYYYLGPAEVDKYLAVYLLVALLLIGRVSLLQRESEWHTARVGFNTDNRIDFLRAGLVVAVAGVLVGWAGPGLAASPDVAALWQEFSGPWSSVREQWMRLFAAVRSYGQSVNDFYGDSLALGASTRLGDTPIIDVRVGPLDEAAPEAGVVLPVPRYYWRAVTYDTYQDGRWLAENYEFQEYDPNTGQELRSPVYRLRRDIRADITSYIGAASRLYTPTQPRWVSRPVIFSLVTTPGGAVEIGAVRSRDILRQGGVYQVVASASVADEASLRLAGELYPEWVLQRYVQLPPEITERTRSLAQQIVRDAQARTPYDQVLAVTNWLRANINYNVEVDAPPPDVEPVDYLLFESRQGYCDYYATAEVVLLRSLNIPARLAGGMSQGEFDAASGVYRVRELNAHAWPEVFFTGYGWVEFEPTVNQDPLVRPERQPQVEPGAETTPSDLAPETPVPQELEDRTPQDEDPGAPREQGIVPWLRAVGTTAAVGTGVTLAAGLLGLLLLLRYGVIGWENLGALGRWALARRGQAFPSLIVIAYLNLERAARWVGLKLSPANTPHERAQALGAAVPEARAGVETITAEYVVDQYSPRPADMDRAGTAWRGIRLPLIRQALANFVRSWTEDELSKVSRRLREQERERARRP